MREKLMHFLNIGTKDAPKYALLGDGINSLTEEFNPEAESKHYINMASASNSVKSYAPSISVEKEYIKNEDLQKWIDEKVRILPTRSDAEADYIRINILEGASADGTYPAIKRPCTYQFDSIGGDGGGPIMNSMTITSNGDIRNKKINSKMSPEERKSILKAKKVFAIKPKKQEKEELTLAEQQAVDEFVALIGLYVH